MTLDSSQAVPPASFEVAGGAVEAVVLAGSYQWSGSSFEELLPRPLLPVAGRTIIDRVIDWLAEGGVSRAVVCANGSTPAIRRHLAQSRSGADVDLHFHRDATPRGAAGCVKDAAKKLTASTIVVADATSIPVFALRALIDQHRRTNAAMTIAAHGSQADASPAGIYIVSRAALEAVPATSFQDIKENLIPKLHGQGQTLAVYGVSTVSPRVLNASSYLALSQWMLERLGNEGTAPPEAWIAPSASVSPDALVIGPVMIGAGARIEANATVVGPSSIGEGSIVESGAVVSRSVVWSKCRIGRESAVDQAVLGDGAVVDAWDEAVKIVKLKQPFSPFAWARFRGRTARVKQLAGLSARATSAMTQRVV